MTKALFFVAAAGRAAHGDGVGLYSLVGSLLLLAHAAALRVRPCGARPTVERKPERQQLCWAAS